MGEQGIKEDVAKMALEEYGDLLMKFPNVVGLGLGLANGNRGRRGGYVVKVYVSKRPSVFRRRIPSKLTLRLPGNPRHVVLVPTVIEEIGQLELETA